MLYGGIADKHRDVREEPGRPRPRRPRHVERRRLHAVRRHLGLAGRRRVGDGLGDDPDDEEGGLRRRLRGERHHARLAGRRAHADQPQHDHLLARRGRQGLDRRADPRRRAADDRADDLHAGRRVPGRGAPRLSGGRVSRAGRGRPLVRRARYPGSSSRSSSSGAFCPACSRRPSRRRSPCSTRSSITVVRLPQRCRWENFLKASAQRGEDDRRGAAADRRVGDLPVPDRPVQRRRPDRRVDGEGVAPSRGWCSC